MKIRSILFILGVTFSQFSLAQQTLPRDPDCCTSIMVGKLASTEGSHFEQPSKQSLPNDQ